MRRAGPFLAALLALGALACSSEPVRLWQLREAPAGSEERAAYERLEHAVELANEFLATSEYARGFPAAGARFGLDHSDVLLTLAGEGIYPMRIEASGWGDLRTAIGDGVHPTRDGFLSARSTGLDASGDGGRDAAFLDLSAEDMAAVLLRQAVMMREIQTRGELGYWLNYDLLGLVPGQGWDEDAPVNRRAYLVEFAFREWLADRA